MIQHRDLSEIQPSPAMLQHLTSILARWRHYPRLKMRVELQVCRPLESTPLPSPRQYAGRERRFFLIM